MRTPENFRSLASMLLRQSEPAAGDTEPVLSGVEAIPQCDTDASEDELELMREIRLFHARIIEAAEAAVERVVSDVAADVLARELLLEPADIEAIVDRGLKRFAAEEPLRVRVHADDAPRLNCSVPAIADERLRAGDAVIELRGGSIDATLGVRLSTVVEAALS